MKGKRTDKFAHPIPSEVSNLARSGLGWSAASLIFRQLVMLISTMVVSRYVSPEQTGIAGIAITMVSLVVLFDIGLTWAIVQPNKLEAEQVDTLQIVSVAVGCVLFCMCVFFGEIACRYFGDVRYLYACAIAGVGVLANSFATIPAALMKRRLMQKKTSLIEGLSIAGGSISALIFSIADLGYIAIVSQVVISHCLRVVFYHYFYGIGLPSGFSLNKVRPLMGSAIFITASNLVSYIQLYGNSIVIGLTCSPEQLGFYMKANALKALPIMYSSMFATDVMVATLSTLRSDSKAYATAYRKGLSLAAFVGFPAGVMLIPLAHESVRVLFGPQWGAVVPLVEIMALSAMITPLATTTLWLFLSSDNRSTQLLMNIALSGLTAVALAIAVSLNATLHQLVALEVFLSIGIFSVVAFVISHRSTKIDLLASVHDIWPFFVAASFSGCSAAILPYIPQLATLNWILLLVAKVLIAVMVYGFLCIGVFKRFPLEFNGLKHFNKAL